MEENKARDWKVPFHEKHLENQELQPNEENRKYMSESSIKECQIDYDKAESEVYFDGIRVEFDTCDCGGGYGCSHGAWPFKAKFRDYPDASMDWEDDELVIEHIGKVVTAQPIEKLTMGDFRNMCDMVGIYLKLK